MLNLVLSTLGKFGERSTTYNEMRRRYRAERMADMVRLRDETCVFPRCGRHARGCDLDHITPHDTGPPDDGPTNPANLAPLCRRHHRAKTAGAWSYERIAPGTYLWTGPAGLTTLVTPDDVIDL